MYVQYKDTSAKNRVANSPRHVQLSPSRTNVLRANIFRSPAVRLFVSAQMEDQPVQSSCAINLPLISRSSAVTPFTPWRKALWCRFSPAVHNEQWSFPNFIAPASTNTFHYHHPAHFVRLLFFSEALRISGQLPATVWRRIGGWWPHVHAYVCVLVHCV